MSRNSYRQSAASSILRTIPVHFGLTLWGWRGERWQREHAQSSLPIRRIKSKKKAAHRRGPGYFMERATDVFIIGGGPAGLAAAIAARQRGLDVIVAGGGRAPLGQPCGGG